MMLRRNLASDLWNLCLVIIWLVPSFRFSDTEYWNTEMLPNFTLTFKYSLDKASTIARHVSGIIFPIVCAGIRYKNFRLSNVSPKKEIEWTFTSSQEARLSWCYGLPHYCVLISNHGCNHAQQLLKCCSIHSYKIPVTRSVQLLEFMMEYTCLFSIHCLVQITLFLRCFLFFLSVVTSKTELIASTRLLSSIVALDTRPGGTTIVATSCPANL